MEGLEVRTMILNPVQIEFERISGLSAVAADKSLASFHVLHHDTVGPSSSTLWLLDPESDMGH